VKQDGAFIKPHQATRPLVSNVNCIVCEAPIALPAGQKKYSIHHNPATLDQNIPPELEHMFKTYLNQFL
jgi:hypothetical protein